MNYRLVLRHIQDVLRACDESVVFLAGDGVPSQHRDGDLSIVLAQTVIKEKNNCFGINPPVPLAKENPPGAYIINRIRISISMISDYEKGFPYSDEALKSYIIKKQDLFGYYE